MLALIGFWILCIFILLFLLQELLLLVRVIHMVHKYILDTKKSLLAHDLESVSLSCWELGVAREHPQVHDLAAWRHLTSSLTFGPHFAQDLYEPWKCYNRGHGITDPYYLCEQELQCMLVHAFGYFPGPLCTRTQTHKANNRLGDSEGTTFSAMFYRTFFPYWLTLSTSFCLFILF